MEKFNIYCDESCHLENDHINIMVLGSIKCNLSDKRIIVKDIRKLKEKYNMNPFCEMKWKKISNNKIQFYKELINYFFDNDYLSFRAVLVDKEKLNHQKFGQTHDTFYYKVYYQLLSRVIVPNHENYIYLDIKDTKSAKKEKKLKECLANDIYDFNLEHIKNVQAINSKESELLQLADILIGAIAYNNRYVSLENRSKAKIEIINLIKQRSSYSLNRSTLLSEEKFNLFFMELK